MIKQIDHGEEILEHYKYENGYLGIKKRHILVVEFDQNEHDNILVRQTKLIGSGGT